MNMPNNFKGKPMAKTRALNGETVWTVPIPATGLIKRDFIQSIMAKISNEYY